jgi:hypothetical protein
MYLLGEIAVSIVFILMIVKLFSKRDKSDDESLKVLKAIANHLGVKGYENNPKSSLPDGDKKDGQPTKRK